MKPVNKQSIHASEGIWRPVSDRKRCIKRIRNAGRPPACDRSHRGRD
uniref:Uncharacterized protein n=1 Tax=Anguilla anguilla TaxID=7936 RepID=A0A0E9Q7P2_ANGAN